MGTSKSPTNAVRTQTNHVFASIIAYVKIEKRKLISKLNHFAMKIKIYLAVQKITFKELTALKTYVQ